MLLENGKRALEVRNVTFRHRKDLRTLLENFSLVVNPGDKVVIIGEEGNGKSTLLRWMHDPAAVADYVEAGGIRQTHGMHLGYLPQMLPEELRVQPLYQFFAEVSDADYGDLYDTAEKLRFPADFYYSGQTLGTLSGGERVKVQMARILLSRPDALLLDEPSNDLDIATLEIMERFIQEFPGPLLFISHDETLISRTANRVVLLEQLRRRQVSRATVSNVPFDVFMAERSAAFARQAQIAQEERREERKARERFQRIEQRVAHEQENISRGDPHGGRLLKKKMANVKALERRYAREHAEMTALPEAEDSISIALNFTASPVRGKRILQEHWNTLCLPEGRVLAEDVSLSVLGGEKWCILGDNGAGKTTLLKACMDVLAPREDLSVFYMPQNYEDRLCMEKSAVEYLAPEGDREAVTRVRTLLGALKFSGEEMMRPLGACSGGQRAKVLLLQLSLSGADVLLLDEPTRNFSPLSGPELRALLRAFPGTILSVSHDRKYIREVCDHVVRLTSRGLVPAEVEEKE